MATADDTAAIIEFINARLDDEAVAAEQSARMARSLGDVASELQPQLDHALRPTGWLAVAPARIARAIDAHLALVEERTRAAALCGESDTARSYADGLAVAIAVLARTWREHPSYDRGWAP